LERWIQSENKADIFETDKDPAACALFRENTEEIYLRQLFRACGHRHQGIGQKAAGILRSQLWPPDRRLTVEVLTNNEPAFHFWRSVGCKDYCLILDIMPNFSSKQAVEDENQG